MNIIPIIGPQCPYLLPESPYMDLKMHNLVFSNHFFLKMAPQAKPLCSRDAHRNSVQNPGLHSPRSLTTTPKP